jgi:positive regulator of sigma E activity
MQETGRVRLIRGGMAEVVVTPALADACRACGSCEDSSDGPVLMVDVVEGVRPGSRVVIEVPEGSDLGPAAVVFFLPVLFLLIGAVLGSMIPEWTSVEAIGSTGFAILGAVGFLLLSLILVRIYDRSRARRGLEPRIISVEA